MRQWSLLGLLLASAALVGWGGTNKAETIKLLGGTYRLERVNVGQSTAIAGAYQKLLVIRYQLGEDAKTINLADLAKGVQALDGRGRAYSQYKGLPIGILRSAEEDTKTFATAPQARANQIFLSTFLLPSTTEIEKISFGEGRGATTIDTTRAVSGLDYYVASGTTPLEQISAKKSSYYVSGGIDIRFDGWTGKTGQLGEIEATEEGEAFIIATFTARNATPNSSELLTPGKEQLQFSLDSKTASSETLLQPNSDNGLDSFELAPNAEKTFRVYWKVPRSTKPQHFALKSQSLGIAMRPIIWQADGTGTTSPDKNAPAAAQKENTELYFDHTNATGIRVAANQLKIKFPNVFKTLNDAKFSSFYNPIPDLNKFTFELPPITAGPTLEGSIFPKTKLDGKAKATKITVQTDGETKISATLQILKSGKVTNEKSGKSIELPCPKNSDYRINFGISVGTPPGIYTGHFLIDDGAKKAITVTYIIAPKTGGVSLSLATNPAIKLEAGEDFTIPVNVNLHGNAKSKVQFNLQNATKGVTMTAETITMNPGETRTINLKFSTDPATQSSSPGGDPMRVTAIALDLNSQSTVEFRALIAPNWGAFHYKGKIGNVMYESDFLFKANGDWVWTAVGSTSSTVSGDTLMQCMVLNYPDNGGRHFIQVAFPLGAKLEKMPGTLTYVATGNDTWIRDNFNEVFDSGFSVKLARIDNGLLSFTNNNPIDPFDSGPIKYVQWMKQQNCKFSLKTLSSKVIK